MNSLTCSSAPRSLSAMRRRISEKLARAEDQVREFIGERAEIVERAEAS